MLTISYMITSISGQTEILWQHPTSGWKVIIVINIISNINIATITWIFVKWSATTIIIIIITNFAAITFTITTFTAIFTITMVNWQPFTPYSWVVEQRPIGQAVNIFLKITEVSFILNKLLQQEHDHHGHWSLINDRYWPLKSDYIIHGRRLALLCRGHVWLSMKPSLTLVDTLGAG